MDNDETQPLEPVAPAVGEIEDEEEVWVPPVSKSNENDTNQGPMPEEEDEIPVS